MSDWVVQICDSTWFPLGQLDVWDSLQMTEKFCDVGDGSLNTSASADHRELVQIGSRIVIRESGRVRQSGLLKFGETFADTIVMRLAWADPLQFLAERLAYPDPANEADAQTVAYDERAGMVSTIIHGYVMANCGPNALPERRVGLLGDDPGIGPWWDAAVQARFEPLLDLGRKVALPAGLGFRITTDDRQHRLEIYQPQDKSESVVFSEITRTSGPKEYTLSPPTATHLIAGGPGEGVARQFLTVSTTESQAQAAAWARRVEQFYDNTSATSPAQLQAEAERQLVTKGETLTAKFQPGVNTDWKYGVDFGLGDTVRCELRPGWFVDRPVIEATTSVSASGVVSVSPLAGDPQATSGLRQNVPVQELRRDMSALQRNR